MKNTSQKPLKLLCGAIAALLLCALLLSMGCNVVEDTAESVGESIANADYEGMYNSCDSWTSGKLRSCYTDEDALDLVGNWKTASGQQIRFDETHMYLDALSFVLTEDILNATGLSGEKEYNLEYAYNEGAIYIIVSKIYIKMFTAELNGDTLTVNFTENFQSVGNLDLSKEYVFVRQADESNENE